MDVIASAATAAGRPESLLVDPFRCRMWALHDRLEEYITEETCRSALESFSRHGQRVAALGRRVSDDPRYDVELIYGARRLFIARQLNQLLRVEIQPLSDRQALVAMDIENRHRTDISPYERGLSYARWLRAGYFASQDELARELRISAPQVSRLLKVARLPALIVGAFETPADIPERWALELMDAWDRSECRAAIRKNARRLVLEKPRPLPREIYESLMALPVPGQMGRVPARHSNRDEVVFDARGKPLFRIRQLQRTVQLSLARAAVDRDRLELLKQVVANALQAPLTSRGDCRLAESGAPAERNSAATIQGGSASCAFSR
jgi:ParB family chromosome partitioning protein